MISTSPIFQWQPRKREAPAGAGSPRWAINLGDLPAWRWAPKAAPQIPRRGNWTLNQGNLPIFAWRPRSLFGTPPEEIKFFCAGQSTALWTPQTSVASLGFECDGVASALWGGKVSLNSSFAFHGTSTTRWEAAGLPLLGSFQANGLSSVFFLVGLDGVIYTCLTGRGSVPSPRIPNFVF